MARARLPTAMAVDWLLPIDKVTQGVGHVVPSLFLVRAIVRAVCLPLQAVNQVGTRRVNPEGGLTTCVLETSSNRLDTIPDQRIRVSRANEESVLLQNVDVGISGICRTITRGGVRERLYSPQRGA